MSGASHDDLLAIQRLDIEARRLRHRREHLEQRADLASAGTDRDRLGAEIEAFGGARLEATSRAKRFEDEATLVSERADLDEQRLYSGEISAAGDLQALQREIKGLRRRQSDLEDKALEAMGEGEEIAARLAALETERAGLDGRIIELSGELASAEAEIDERLTGCEAERHEAAGRVEESLLGEYEKLRAWLADDFVGDAVVSFAGGNCVGCPSSMPAVEADRIHRTEAGSVQSCGECGRMVLR